MKYADILQIAPYSLNKQEKENIMTQMLLELTDRHIEKCSSYASMMNTIGYDKKEVKSYG